MIQTDTYSILLLNQELNLAEAQKFIADKQCGAENYFVGKVRNHNKGVEIISLEFSAYEPMAIKEMEKIALLALEKFDIKKIAIYHRIGLLEITETPVIIAVSSHHRQASFDACVYAIDTLKQTVPIWKKEQTTDGTIWVNAHP